MSKKILSTFVLVLILFFTNQAFASLTFTTDAITGTTNSSIDLGVGNNLFLQTSGGNVGIGTTTPIMKFTVQSNVDEATSYFGTDRNEFNTNGKYYIDRAANNFALKYTGGSNFSSPLRGVLQSSAVGSGTPSAIYGLAEATHDSGTLGSLLGTGADVYNSGNGTVTNMKGVETYLANTGGGSVTKMSGFHGYLDNWTNGTVSKMYGINVGGFGNYATGSITDAYGIYVEDYSDAQNTWGLYIKGNTFKNYIAGNVGIGTTTPGQKLTVNGGIQLSTVTAKPTCDATTRGTVWYVAGGTGVADTYEVCGKAAADTYSWVAAATF